MEKTFKEIIKRDKSEIYSLYDKLKKNIVSTIESVALIYGNVTTDPKTEAGIYTLPFMEKDGWGKGICSVEYNHKEKTLYYKEDWEKSPHIKTKVKYTEMCFENQLNYLNAIIDKYISN